jgi:hypothetical protein
MFKKNWQKCVSNSHRVCEIGIPIQVQRRRPLMDSIFKVGVSEGLLVPLVSRYYSCPRSFEAIMYNPCWGR